jgi:hypothetical protein
MQVFAKVSSTTSTTTIKNYGNKNSLQTSSQNLKDSRRQIACVNREEFQLNP